MLLEEFCREHSYKEIYLHSKCISSRDRRASQKQMTSSRKTLCATSQDISKCIKAWVQMDLHYPCAAKLIINQFKGYKEKHLLNLTQDLSGFWFLCLKLLLEKTLISSSVFEKLVSTYSKTFTFYFHSLSCDMKSATIVDCKQRNQSCSAGQMRRWHFPNYFNLLLCCDP